MFFVQVSLHTLLFTQGGQEWHTCTYVDANHAITGLCVCGIKLLLRTMTPNSPILVQ